MLDGKQENPGKREDTESPDAREAGSVSTFVGRKALVVGGSGGIGRAVCRVLAEKGAEVLVHGRSPEKVESCVAELGLSARGLVFDIRSPRAFIERVAEFGPVDILVVAFGPFVYKPLAAHTPEDWEKLALLDLALPGAAVSHYLPGMLDKGWGRILLFGGTRTDSIRGFRSNAAYAAAKIGVDVIVKSVAMEGADRGVAAVAVCPGLVETEFQSVSERARFAEIAPNATLYSPQDIARVALDLLDRDPCPASGSIVSLDGGFSPV